MEKENINKESLINLSKDKRIFLFLLEVNKNKNIDRKEIENLYLKKYKLSEKSSKINIRVIERFIGVYNKYSKEEKEEKKRNLESNLREIKKVKIEYKDLVNSYKEIKEKIKRSNKIKSIVDLKEIDNFI